MHIFHNKITFSPTDLVRFFESEFASYMDHFEKVVSEEMRKELGVHRDPPNPLYSLIIDMGNKHEENLINKTEKIDSVIRIETDRLNRSASIEQTLLAMKKGEGKIYQAAIKKDIIFGYADLLVKTKGDSVLGEHHYIPYDFKISRHPKPSALIQLCCYCDILESIQGVLPACFIVVTKDETPHLFKTSAFFHFYQFLKEKFLHYHSAFSEDDIPVPDKMAEHRDWSIFARKRLHTLDDISLVAGIRSTHAVILRREGIKKLSDLPKSKDLSPKGIPGVTLRILKDQAAIQLASMEKEKPEFKLLPHTGERQGLEMLPVENSADVFFDMEGYPLLGTEGLEYLYGNAIHEEPKYICFWATSAEEEALALKSWLDWVYRRWQENPGMHIYHYGHYEVSTIKKLIGKYGTGEKEIDNLLRNQVFVDLYRIVTQALRIGVFSYSIKEVEQLFYNKRSTEVKTGGQAAVHFFHFLNSDDTIETSLFLKKIKSYNQDDCFSTRALCQFLWNLQKKHNIEYISFDDKEAKEKKHRRSSIKEDCEEKAQELLSQVPIQKRALHLSQMKQEKELYITRLLANLLEFHIREDKPGWWDYFSRLDMNEEEMLEDRQIIASCRLVESISEKNKIRFEREQEINFDLGDTVIILENKDTIWETYTISDLDLIAGSLCLIPKKQNNIPSNKTFTLVPEKNDFYKKNLFQSLLITADDFSPYAPFMGLKKCIYDLLLRKSPDLPGHIGTLILNKDRIIEEASAHVLNLKNSVFCIQGPPGSGKTYTAAHIILNLIKEGKRVGVTANSHRAIANVLKTMFEQKKDSFCFQCQKVSNRKNILDDQIFFDGLPIELVDSNQINEEACVVGGTTFFFSRENQEAAFDYLFVDEASQVSLSNMVAAARATKNIVLIGDQNQLNQPIQASHPGESGHSVLTYYTDGKTTISEDRGIFLPISYRMHPQICQFISNHFYNGKLTHHITTAQQKILLPDSLKSYKSTVPESGLCFIPMKHSGNAHASIEEAKVISYIYKELLKAKWINRNGEICPITTKDILIVAPYNFQVACLKKELIIEDARIASVDKFQGQEAPISILSLTASTIQDAPRGIDFLLNKNRLNVALSRARCLSVIVGSTSLADTNISSISNLELMNIWCQIVSTTLPSPKTINI